jgi:Asp/Glu/hydantoin racemase
MKTSDPDNPAIATGGKNVYAASLGILMLESRFPRIPGDVGNAATWNFPVHYKVVKGASPDKVVRRGAEGLLEAFVSAGQELIDMGADGIATNCGFMALLQREMSQALSVPVAASSLMQVPMVQATLPPGKRVGIITISKDTLSDAHLSAAGVPLDTPVIGTDEGLEFTRAILDDEPYLDVAQSQKDITQAGRELLTEHPDVGSVVLECTNMVPYAAALQRELQLPVYSIYNLLCWFQSGLAPRTFDKNYCR